MAISVPMEYVVEKIKAMQALRFYVQSLEPTIDEKVRIVAKLLDPDEPLQKLDSVDMEELKQKIRVLKDSRKKTPYVW